MAHEVNNHLAAALLELELALHDDFDPGTRDLLERLQVAVDSAGGVCRSTLGLLRPDPAATQPGKVGDAVRRSVACLGRLRNRVVVEVDTNAAVAATPLSLVSMQQVILNGVLNALQVAEGDVQIIVGFAPPPSTTKRRPSPSESDPRSTWNTERPLPSGTLPAVHISIQDSGPGMPESLRHQLESPSRHGAIERVGRGGLGLSVMKHLVATSGGTLLVTKRKPNGTCINIVLPQVAPTEARRAA